MFDASQQIILEIAGSRGVSLAPDLRPGETRDGPDH